MPDTPAERMRRMHAHRAGDHSLGRAERRLARLPELNGQDEPGPLAGAGQAQ